MHMMCVCVSAHACKHKLMRTVTVYETIFLIWAVFLEHLMSQFCALPTAYFSKALITIITTTSYHFFLAPTPNVILQVKTDNGLKKTKLKLGGVFAGSPCQEKRENLCFPTVRTTKFSTSNVTRHMAQTLNRFI